MKVKKYYNVTQTTIIGASAVSNKRPKSVYVKSEINKQTWSEWLTADEIRDNFPNLAKDLFN